MARPGRYSAILKERHSLYTWRDLLEQFQPFAADAVFIQHEAGSVAAGPGEGFDEAGAYRFGDLHEHDRYRASGLQQWPRACTASGQDDVGCERGQFRRASANALGVARSPADVNANVAAIDPARLRQRLCERQDTGLPLWIVRRVRHEHADPPHAVTLRARRERPHSCRPAERG